MTFEQACEARRLQGVRVANASRRYREKELERYETIDALCDEIYWSEQMRQGVLPLDLSYQKREAPPAGSVSPPGGADDYDEIPF